MKLTVITHVWNEAFLFPYWLRHHYPMFDRGVVIDYGSTDGTPDLVRELAPGWEVRRSRNAMFDARQADLEVMDVEREFDGWKVVLNVTEFLYHRDLRGLLGQVEQHRPEVRGLWTKDFVMVDRPEDADDAPSDEPLFSQKRFGYPAGGLRSRLVHRCADGRYCVGRHDSGVVPKAKTLSDEILLAWFGWCPIKSVWQRKLAIQRMVPESDKQLGYGRQHLVTDETLRSLYADEVSKCVDLMEACPRYAQVIEELQQARRGGPLPYEHRTGSGERVGIAENASDAQQSSQTAAADVSVVVSAYNSAPFIARTLRSVFSQSLLPREVIVVDDASTDETPSIVQWLARRSVVPVRLLRLNKRSGGPALPLNVGIDAAVAPVIATLDHDDVMLPNKLERQLNCLNRFPAAGIIVTRVRTAGLARGGERDPEAMQAYDQLSLTPLEGRCYRIAAKDAYEALLTYGCFWGPCSNLVFRKSTFAACGRFNQRLTLNADYAFVQRVASAQDLCFVDEVLLERHLRYDGHYRSAAIWLKSAERLAVLWRFDPHRLSGAGRKIARERLRAEFFRFLQQYWERCRTAALRRLRGFGRT